MFDFAAIQKSCPASSDDTEIQKQYSDHTSELKMALMHKLFIEGLRHEPQKQTEITPVPKSREVVTRVHELEFSLRR